MGGMTTLGSLDINGSGSCSIFSNLTLNPGSNVPVYKNTNARFHTPLIHSASATTTIYEDDVPQRRAQLEKFTLTSAKVTYRYKPDAATAAPVSVTYATQANGYRVGPFYNNNVVRNAANTAFVLENTPSPYSTVYTRGHEVTVFNGLTDFYRTTCYNPAV